MSVQFKIDYTIIDFLKLVKQSVTFGKDYRMPWLKMALQRGQMPPVD